MASLRAEASMLEQHQRIANEELRINQLKEKSALETQLAKLAAEERVCVEFKTLSGSCCEEEASRFWVKDMQKLFFILCFKNVICFAEFWV